MLNFIYMAWNFTSSTKKMFNKFHPVQLTPNLALNELPNIGDYVILSNNTLAIVKGLKFNFSYANGESLSFTVRFIRNDLTKRGIRLHNIKYFYSTLYNYHMSKLYPYDIVLLKAPNGKLITEIGTILINQKSTSNK